MDGEKGGRKEGNRRRLVGAVFPFVASRRLVADANKIELNGATRRPGRGCRPSVGRAGCCRDGLVDDSCRPSATPHVVREEEEEGGGPDASICGCGKGSHSNRSSSSEFE